MLKLETEVRQYLNTLKRSASLTKEETRAVLLERKLELLQMRRGELKRVEGVALSLLRRVDYGNIKPCLVFCAPKDKPVWDYLRNVVSSAPWTDRPGRALFLFCVDQVSGGILGIVDLGSDLAILGPRDRYIGWTQERRLTKGGLRHVMNLGTCVAAAPFGMLTGGKYMSVAVTSRELGETWHKRYGDILAGVTTTSLYGESSQYNRLDEYKYLGTTNGGGIANVNERGKKMLEAFLKQNEVRTIWGRNAGSGGSAGGYNNTLNKVFKACAALKIDPASLGSSQPRGVYFCERGPDALPFLRGEIDTFTDTMKTGAEISDWWLQRWYKMRLPKKAAEIAAFDYETYRVDAQMELCRTAIHAAEAIQDATGDQPGEGGASPTLPLHSNGGAA